MSQTRQLAAIMFTDIVGYTALMGRDEQKAFDFLNKNRQIQKPIIDQHGGHWIKELGDGVLASFTTVSDAVTAAIKIQEACNATKDFQLRIGIHLGEVVFENDDMFGDGVNIASRLQTIAQPGGIYISESIYNNISNKQGIQARFVKQESLRNVKEPIRIYEVLIEGLQPASSTKENIQLERKSIHDKSIGVLPFVNISTDPEQEYFSDGLTEELIANLSRLKEMRIVSRTTSMLYKGTKKGIQTIGSEMGVHYILEGSVRKSGDNLRITAQLIDVGNDNHLWAETYKGNIGDVFDIQEQVSRQIVDALKITLTPAEDQVLVKRSTLNPEAFDCYLRGRDFLYRRTKKNVLLAIQLFQRAIELDPHYAAAYAGLGESYATFYQVYEKKETWLEKSIESSLKALDFDSELSEAYAALGVAYFNKNLVTEGLAAAQRAIALDPNSYIGFWILGRLYHLSDRDQDAAAMFEKVTEIHPDFYPAYADLQMVYDRLGATEKSSALVDKMLDNIYPRYLSKHPDDDRAHLHFAIYCAKNSREQQARQEAAKALELNPEDSTILYNGACFYAVIDDKETALALLKKAIEAGFEYFEWLKRDPDFDNIREEEEFVNLMKGK
jgi:adenylate cyclase